MLLIRLVFMGVFSDLIKKLFLTNMKAILFLQKVQVRVIN